MIRNDVLVWLRAQVADALRRNAENNAAATYSGLNLENELRKQYRYRAC